MRASAIPVVLLVATVALGQEPVRPLDSDEQALRILDAAIAQQGPKEYAVPGAIENLTVKIAVRVYDYSKDPPEKISLDVRRYLRMDPTVFRTEWKTATGIEVYGREVYGEKAKVRYWSASYDANGKLSSRFLFGDDHASTRERIDAEIAETKHLLGLFFLANLRGPGAVFKLVGSDKVKIKDEHECFVISRMRIEGEKADPPLSLWIEKKTHRLVKALVHAVTEEQRSLIFLFRYDEEYRPRVKGVLFPMKIEVRERAFKAKESRPLSLATVEAIDFNSDLDPALFRRPMKK